MHFVLRSRIGLVFKAIRDDELGTTVLGLSVVRYKLLNFVIASFFVGTIGAFYAHFIGILVPTSQEFGMQRTVEILTIAYVGGRGTLWGSLLGAIVLVGIQEVFRDLEEWRLVIYGLALISIITLFPGGLAGGVLQLGERIRGYMALFSRNHSMTMLPNSVEARDVAYHLHSYSNPKALAETGPLVIDRGEGIYVYDTAG
eukprot:gene64530-88259_t